MRGPPFALAKSLKMCWRRPTAPGGPWPCRRVGKVRVVWIAAAAELSVMDTLPCATDATSNAGMEEAVNDSLYVSCPPAQSAGNGCLLASRLPTWEHWRHISAASPGQQRTVPASG